MNKPAAQQLRAWWGLWLGLGLGALVRFNHIAKASIWHDEGYTMMLAPMPPAEIIARTARDVHPPLHYLVLHYWVKLFGTSEAAARSLSAIAMLVTIVVAWLLVKKLFGRGAANISALFISFGPFLVRYSQEARMYALIACLAAAATLLLVYAQQSNQIKHWIIYAVLMALAFYTHYYALFVVVAHWTYMAICSRQKGQGLQNPRWWLANVGIVALFAPWVPSAYAQFTRVQAAFWIPPVDVSTLPATLAQFMTFTSLGSWPLWARLLGTAGFLAMLLALFFGYSQKRHVILLSTYLLTGPLLVFILSLGRPIYVDRYFVFSAVAFYAVLAVFVSLPWLAKVKALQTGVIIGFMAIFMYGINNVYHQANHQMKAVAGIVNERFQAGDEIISGELYTYFDFSYYNRTGEAVKLLAPDGVSGYGETSLIYDRADKVVLNDYSQLGPTSGRVWVVGKTGDKEYFEYIPPNWSPIGPRYEAGYSAVQLYLVSASRQRVAAGPVL